MKKVNPTALFGCLYILLMAFLIAAMVFLLSCSSVRTVERVKIERDSVSIRERDSLLQVSKDDSVYIKSLNEQIGENKIIFNDTGSTKIIYRPDGSIESIEGKLKSANSKLTITNEQVSYWKSHYDSLSRVKSKDSIRIETVTNEKIVQKKITIFPWWLVLLAAIFAAFYLWKVYKTKSPI
jgi:hypothetical protein